MSQNHNILWFGCALTTNRQLCSAIVPDFGVFDTNALHKSAQAGRNARKCCSKPQNQQQKAEMSFARYTVIQNVTSLRALRYN
ncbi:hypothetical protein CYJ68_06350 [Gardnerella vaginalis]|nr:hypothetical protein CYJ68_06350 [Gardnerella vaginalis]